MSFWWHLNATAMSLVHSTAECTDLIILLFLFPGAPPVVLRPWYWKQESGPEMANAGSGLPSGLAVLLGSAEPGKGTACTQMLQHFNTRKALIHSFWGLFQVPEIQYFGANALHTKISRYWSDIPSDQYESLKTQLFSQIACFSSGSKMVLTRLCVALASLALNTMPEAWPGAVAEMVRVFQEEGGGVDGRARCLALLELLTVLPEEFQTCRLPQQRKGQVWPSPPAAGGNGNLTGITLVLLFISSTRYI